jgi:hypothetical protein
VFCSILERNVLIGAGFQRASVIKIRRLHGCSILSFISSMENFYPGVRMTMEV